MLASIAGSVIGSIVAKVAVEYLKLYLVDKRARESERLKIAVEVAELDRTAALWLAGAHRDDPDAAARLHVERPADVIELGGCPFPDGPCARDGVHGGGA